MNIQVYEGVFKLLPEKALVWPKHHTLFLADAHLGKVNHFRKAGIPVPSKANEKNIEILIDLANAHKPKRIIFLGDLFHSHYNPEWEAFGEIVKHFTHISFELIMGNHDIMSAVQYARKGIVVHDELTLDNIIFSHHPIEKIDSGHYNIAGHVHPGVYLSGRGRQALTLPCFYFGKQQGLLPAFGMFTGLAKIKPKRDDRVYVIVENKVMEINTN